MTNPTGVAGGGASALPPPWDGWELAYDDEPLDPDSTAYAYCPPQGVVLHVAPRRLVVQGAEAGQLQGALQAESYDVVCARQVVDVQPDPMAFIVALLELVKPGGVLVMSHVEGDPPRASERLYGFAHVGDDLVLTGRGVYRSVTKKLGLRTEVIVSDKRLMYQDGLVTVAFRK